jgi:hypothetical protein
VAAVATAQRCSSRSARLQPATAVVASVAEYSSLGYSLKL